MKSLSIDIETYSSVDLEKSGVYRYAEDPDFALLLFGYSVDGGEVKVVDVANGERLPDEILRAIFDDTVIKYAFNANFERVCLSRHFSLSRYLKPDSWRCTMVWGAYLGLPMSLKAVGEVLRLKNQKLDEGANLIKLFCTGKPRVKNGIQNWELWEQFKEYNRRDVEVECEIRRRLERYPVPQSVWDEYVIDQRINDRGVAVDMEFVNAAIRLDKEAKEELKSKLTELTGLTNPASPGQMKKWLAEREIELESLSRDSLKRLIEAAPIEDEIREVLAYKAELNKTSVKKYTAIKNTVCADGRLRGMFRFYGAARTGRWSGQLVQLQNLPRHKLDHIDDVRRVVMTGDYDFVKLLYMFVPDTLSQLIRTAFVPREGHTFYVADFAAIEARVLAWYAGEKWRQQVFSKGGDIYSASASQMFKLPVEHHGVNSHLRQKGKIAELALGYGGSVGALKAMGALEMGLSEEELYPLVQSWRMANPKIVKFWWDVDRAAVAAVRDKKEVKLNNLTFESKAGMLRVTLPSGRQLTYLRPGIGINKFGGECVVFEGVGTTKKWEKIEAYGPKLVENIVQATARDILCYAVKNLEGLDIVMHIHDELVIESHPEVTLDEIRDIMGRTPPWAPGLELRADGFESKFYKKD